MPGFNDNEQTAGAIAATIDDPRVAHFYDPMATHLAGKAFAEGVVRRGPAWDIYFFYDKGLTWTDHPPKATELTHQLGGNVRADPDRFRSGLGLADELHELTHKVTGAECTPDAP